MAKKITNKEYQKFCDGLKPTSYNVIRGRLDDNKIDLLHACLGLTTETAEIVDVIKKHIYYGKSIDSINLKEEIGDILWYISTLLNALGLTYEEVMELNVEKLTLRYGGTKFSEDKAINRNLNKERKLLEGKKEKKK